MLYTQITPQMAHLLMRPWHTTSNRLLSSRCSLPYTVGTLPRLRSAPGDHIQITRCRRWRICPRRALVRLLLQEVAHAADGYDLQRISLCSWSDRSKRKACHQQSWARSGPAGGNWARYRPRQISNNSFSYILFEPLYAIIKETLPTSTHANGRPFYPTA
jgi:hypothetical protein